MNFYIEFENTLDKIPFYSESNTDILQYFVQNLNKLDLNKFINQKKSYIDSKILNDHLKEVNQYLVKYINKTFPKVDDSFDQDYLNKLHYIWANWQVRLQVDAKSTGLLDYYHDDNLFPYLNDVLSKIGQFEHYSKVNDLLHKMEFQFNVLKCSTNHPVSMENPFPKDRCTNDISNFNMPFTHLGRPLCNKWETWDTEFKYNDENTFNTFHGYVEIKLQRPQTINYSSEYIDWCKKMNFVPSGNFVTLGNIPDLEKNLTKYRNIVYNNRNNHFTIKLGDIDGKAV